MACRSKLEHDTRFPDADATNNHPVLAGNIVLAHLKESLLCYLYWTDARLVYDDPAKTLDAENRTDELLMTRLLEGSRARTAVVGERN